MPAKRLTAREAFYAKCGRFRQLNPVAKALAIILLGSGGLSQAAQAPSAATSGREALIPEAEGWTCLGRNSDSWDCSLKGTDPSQQPKKGLLTRVKETILPGEEARKKAQAEEESLRASLLKPDPSAGGLGIIALDSQVASFDMEDETVFATLQDMAGTDAWGTCGTMVGPMPETEGWVEGEATVIEADYTEVYDQDIATFTGDVELTRASQKLYADEASYDRTAETIFAKGDVRYREPGISLAGDRVFIKQKTGKSRLQDARFLLENIPARGRAGTAYRESATVNRFRNVAYTTCQPGNNDWVLGAEYLKLDRGTGRATARHAWLKLADIPVFYTPYISFPIDDRRKSGFLAPSFGSSDETGFDAATPFYWNIAPHMDATITPRYVGKRGAMLGAEYRYLTDWTEGYISGEYMPDDDERDEARGQFSFFNRTRVDQYLTANADLNWVSDDDYLDELGNTLSFSNTSHVRSDADVTYRRWGMMLSTRIQHWQTIDDDIRGNQQPYKRLPQVLFNINDRPLIGNLHAGLGSEFVYFNHSDKVSAKRLDVKTRFSYPIKNAHSFITPKLTLEHTQYWYDQDDDEDDVDSSDSRTLPIFSVDSGLFFERDTSFGDANYIQTLEPRAFYLYVPHDDQDDIPVFDTAQYDFSYHQLFRENRFSGTDRINDANQLTLAVSTRFINASTGLERLRASIGSIFYFKDLEVSMPGQEDYEESTSNIVGELYTQLSNHWSFNSAFQWNPNTSDGDRRQFALQYKNTQEKLFNIAYRYRKDLIEQTDATFRWPIPFTENWKGVGRWQYSWRDDLTLDSFLGLERESCCWRFRVLGRHYANDGDGESNNGIYVQLELKGFTSFGDDVDQFLEESIRGYRRPEY